MILGTVVDNALRRGVEILHIIVSISKVLDNAIAGMLVDCAKGGAWPDSQAHGLEAHAGSKQNILQQQHRTLAKLPIYLYFTPYQMAAL